VCKPVVSRQVGGPSSVARDRRYYTEVTLGTPPPTERRQTRVQSVDSEPFGGRTHAGLPRFAGRYEIEERLKQGNGVDTVVAADLDTGARVVLKTFERTSVQAPAQARFVHEARVLSTLTGLGLGRLLDFGQTEDHLYLAQQLVPGTTLERAIAAGPLPVAGALRVGIELAGALDLAHSAAVLHRDVKPANVIVSANGPDRQQIDQVTLVDFGFSRSPWLDDTLRDEFVGTVRYMAPESAGLLNTLPDERSDLYALGVVLFECLAGRPPFEGPGVGDLLRQHLSMPAPDLRADGRLLPRALAAAVSRLLRKDPAERYQSAAALAADLRQILAAVEHGDPDPPVIIGRHDLRSSLTDPAFVGRDTELAALGGLVSRLSRGIGGLVMLDADSGGGKSRLLSEISELAREIGVTVVHGQGVALSGQRPFTLLHGVADDLVRIFADDPDRRQSIATRVRDAAPAIVRALPALSELIAAQPGSDSGPEQFGELRSIDGLCRLLSVIGSADRPILMVLDDCQWADTLTVRLLSELFGGSPGGPRHLGVIAAFRSEEVPRGHPLRSIPASEVVHLGPLTDESVALLAESMAGPLPDEAVDIVTRLGDGNPFMAAAVLRGLVESGALAPSSAGWAIDATRLPDIQAARRSAVVLVQRLELLGSESLRLLSVGAVLGKQFDIDTAVLISGGRGDGTLLLEDARRRRLLWVDESRRTCTFFHDKIRESLLARLPDQERRALHSRAADAIDGDRTGNAGSAGDRTTDTPGDDLVFDLAYHLAQAGRLRDAVPHALRAAALARGRFALDSAATYFAMAADGVEESDLASRVLVAEGLGDVLMLQGVYSEAERQLATARTLTDDPLHAADLDTKLGALAFKQGDIPTAKQHLEGALARLGRRIPHRHALPFALVWELLVQFTHTVAPKLTTGRRSATGREADFLAMRIHSRLAYLYWFHSGRIGCAWTHLRGMNLAERYPRSPELAQAWSEHAPALTMLPWYSRAVRYALRSFELRRDVGDVWGQGQSLNFTGVAQYAASDFVAAQEACEQAIRLLRRTGDQWEVNTASWTLAACLLRQGQLARAVRVADDTYRAATAIGDKTAAGISLSIWARATGGLVPAELIEHQLAEGSEDAQTTAELHLADALVRRAAGDRSGAVDAVQRGVSAVREAGLRQEFIAPIFPWRATMMRELAESTPAHDPGLRTRRLKEAAAAARTARRWSRSYRNNAPHAYRELALIASLRGRAQSATALLERSLSVAERQGATYEAALSRLASTDIDLGRAGSRRVPDAARLAGIARDEARTALDAFAPSPGWKAEAPITISVLDRFATLLRVGRAIAATTTLESLETVTRASAVDLLRAERCQLTPVAAQGGTPVLTASGDELAGLSRTLLLRAIDRGEPVVAIDEHSDSTDSLTLSGIRSALAAPILVHGEVVSCLYMTHRQLGEVFGDEEIQLAAFITTLAGAAYEHLAGSETRFRSLAQSSSDVITLVDAGGVVTYQSAAAGRVFGLPAPGMVGRPVTSWAHPEDVDRLAAVLQTPLGAVESRIECRLLHGDGTYRFTETAVTNMLDEPTVSAVVLNIRDVTDRMLVEQQLREKNGQLEKLSRAKDTFLASMSHELRTPLNAIIGFTGTMLMRLPGPLNDDQDRQLRTVERSGKHLLSIINDLLDLTKIESGELSLTLGDVACSPIVSSVVATLQPLADEKRLTLTVRLPRDEVVVRSEERALGQILINLVSNAIKFTDLGHVDVHLIADAAGRRITVTDTGPGIPRGDLARIFDAFDRGEDGHRRSQEGTGLGLHISRKLGELVGARVSVVTELGHGSAFTIEFGDAGDGT
jgi:PAS domain S-box-containing protein